MRALSFLLLVAGLTLAVAASPLGPRMLQRSHVFSRTLRRRRDERHILRTLRRLDDPIRSVPMRSAA